MAIVRRTSADILAMNASEELVGLIRQAVELVPELAVFPASPISKTVYDTLVRTALPSVGFRVVNAGREHQKSTVTNRTVTCLNLDASWSLDGQAARQSEWGVDAVCAMEAADHLEAAFHKIASQIWYGVGTGGDAAGFAGLAALLANTDSDMVVDATGSTATTGSSVFAVKFGLRAVQLAWGNDAKISEGERLYAPIYLSAGTSFWGYSQQIEGFIGLQATDYYSIGRICNLTAQTSHTLTDAMIFSLIQKFMEQGKGLPDAMFCSPRSLFQLRTSRTATNPGGQPAPIPTEVAGVPLYPTTAILDTETILTASGT